MQRNINAGSKGSVRGMKEIIELTQGVQSVLVPRDRKPAASGTQTDQ